MIEFNGQQFESMKEWARAYPAYGRHFAKYIKRGAKSPQEIEQMAYEAQCAGIKKRDAAPNALRESQKQKRRKE